MFLLESKHIKVIFIAIILPFVFITALIANDEIKKQVEIIDNRAQEYYDNKQFRKAITEWIRALELDPENEKIQLKIEMVYEEKHKKDIAFQKSKKYYYEAQDKLNQETFNEGEEVAVAALENFAIAYRIAPNDPELIAIKDRMVKLNQKLKVEREKNRISKEKLEKYNQYQAIADNAYQNKDYQTALTNYENMLSIIPGDLYALEKKRQTEIAIENRLKWEKIKKYFDSGNVFIAQKKYKEALKEFEQVLLIDPENDDAKEKIANINDLIEKQEDAERRRLQAEQFYLSGIENLKNNLYDSAREDFQNALSLIENYKDAKARLASIPRLEKAYLERVKKQKLQIIDKEYRNGLFNYSQGNYQAALGSFEKILKLDPENKSAEEYLKKSKEALSQQKEEIVDENSPYYNIINPLIVSGKALYEQGKYKESLNRWNQITEIFPRNKIAGRYILMCQYKLNPDSYEKFAAEKIEEGKQYLKEKKYEKALYTFKLIKEISPDYPGIDDLIEQSQKAEKKYNAPKISQARINALYNEAIRLYRAGGKSNIDKAIRNLQIILKNDPNNYNASITLNRIQSEQSIGVKKTERKQTLTPEQQAYVRKHYFNGINLYAKGKFREAIAEWRKVLAVDPNNVKAKNNIRRTLRILKD